MDLYQITTRNLCFSYKRKKKDIKNLNLMVPRGSIYGFLGRNGSGKTTTIRLLLGLLKPDSGEVKIFGKSLKDNRMECLSKTGALIENPSLYEHLTARENLKIISNYLTGIRPERISEVLDIVELTSSENTRVKEFSLGMKQRLGLASCLLHKPELLILDEPTNGLDPQGILQMRRLLKNLNSNEGTTIFLSSHILSEVEKLCSHFGIIKDGEIVFQNSVKEFKSSRETNLQVEIVTDDLEKTNDIVQSMTLQSPIFVNSHLLLSLKEKRQIPLLIDRLRKNDIDVFELKIKNDLENFFLELTQKNT